MPVLKDKKIAVVIAFKGFKDPEYFIPKDILEKAGAKISTVSSRKGTAIGDDGGEAEVDQLVSETDPADFDATVFVGGPGMSENLDNKDFHRLAVQTLEAGNILAAICIAPALLAKAGVLEGKKAVVWYNPFDKTAIRILEENGAEFVDTSVVVDGRVVTACGPDAAEEFGQTLVRLLTGSGS